MVTENSPWHGPEYVMTKLRKRSWAAGSRRHYVHLRYKPRNIPPGKWFGCTVRYMKHVDGPLYICNTAQPIAGGMSGSPVILDDGTAIGIVSLSSNPEGLAPEIAA